MSIWKIGAAAALFALPLGLFSQEKPYFQQRCDVTIEVRLDDQAHMLHARETFVYTNHSPDALDGLWIHLWPNAFSGRGSAFADQKVDHGSSKFYFAPEEERGYIDSLDFEVNGQKVALQPHPEHADIAYLKLPQSLAPGQSVGVSTPFRVKIPNSFSRLGHIKQQYQITQWFPKPAVYDREGWHPIPYLDQGEFFSEFGTFDVTIEVPKDYVVGATGNLDPRSPEWDWLAERERQTRELLLQPKDSTKIPFPEVSAPGETKKLRFTQENVHDFAWFCDKQYFVLADTAVLPESGKEVRCVAMFTNMDRDYWKRGAEFVKQAVFFYSKWNGDYPYDIATAVDGALSAGAGMEYPTITVLGAGGSAGSLETVIVHEVGHNWYYGILASNEREHPWMDEGLNSFFENRYTREEALIRKEPGEKKGLAITLSSTSGMAQVGLQVAQGYGVDQAIELPAEAYSSLNYGLDVYMKTSMTFRYLEEYLGKEVTDQCFHAYYAKWKFKHPYPADIQAVFEEVSGKDLDWFFNGLILKPYRIDFRVKSLLENSVTLQNRTGTALPANLVIYDKEGNILESIWTDPFEKEITVEIQDAGAAHHVRTNPKGLIPEYRTDNNRMRAHGPFKHCKHPAFKFGFSLPNDSAHVINYVPTLGYNTTDGFMAGLTLYHGTLPQYNFEYHLTGMYGFRSHRPTGSIGFTRHWRPSKVFRKIELQVRGANYANLIRGRIGLDFQFQQAVGSKYSHGFSLQSFLLGTWQEDGTVFPDNAYLPVYGAFRWNTSSHDAVRDISLQAELGGNSAEKTYRGFASLSYKRQLSKKLWASGRVFGGGFYAPDGAPYLLQLRMGGSNDPFGEHILLDRARISSTLSHQIVSDHGGFHSLNGLSFDQYLATVNLEFGYKMFSGFFDYGMGRHSVTGASNGRYVTGLRIALPEDIFALNIPILEGGDPITAPLPSSFKGFTQRMTFSFEPLNAITLVKRQLGVGR